MFLDHSSNSATPSFATAFSWSVNYAPTLAQHGTLGFPAWWVAIALTLVGTTLVSTGLVLKKDSHNRDQLKQKIEDAEEELLLKECYFLSQRWIWGMGIFILGHLVCWMGLALGTQVVLSCLNVWSMVVAFVVAPLLLNETVSLHKVASVVVIIIGVVVVILFGPRGYQPYTVKLFVANLENPLFLVFSGCAAAMLVILAMQAWCTSKRPRLPPAGYTLASAMTGWYSVLSAKCVAGLLFTSWHWKNSQIGMWITWVVLLVFLLFAVLNVHLMNVALKHGDAVLVIPMYESFSILGQVFLGGIFFNEFDELHGAAHVGFWIGVSLVIAGIAVMTGNAGSEDGLGAPRGPPQATGCRGPGGLGTGGAPGGP